MIISMVGRWLFPNEGHLLLATHFYRWDNADYMPRHLVCLCVVMLNVLLNHRWYLQPCLGIYWTGLGRVWGGRLAKLGAPDPWKFNGLWASTRNVYWEPCWKYMSFVSMRLMICMVFNKKCVCWGSLYLGICRHGVDDNIHMYVERSPPSQVWCALIWTFH